MLSSVNIIFTFTCSADLGVMGVASTSIGTSSSHSCTQLSHVNKIHVNMNTAMRAYIWSMYILVKPTL